MKNYVRIICSFYILFSAGCKTVDTCNKDLGATFQEITVKQVIREPNNSAIAFQLEVTSLDTLPNIYFKDFKTVINDRDPYGNAINNSAKYIRNVVMGSSNIKITISEAMLQERDTIGFHFRFQFKDRRTFINCTHAGGADKYVLMLQGNLVHNSSSALEIASFSWEEDFIPGSY